MVHPPLGKPVWRFFNKSEIQLPCGSVIPLMGINPKEMKARAQTDICAPIFIAALFTIDKMWSLKSPMTN